MMELQQAQMHFFFRAQGVAILFGVPSYFQWNKQGIKDKTKDLHRGECWVPISNNKNRFYFALLAFFCG
jgi:hypothetical protein